jgi:hypothetical protein
MGVKLILWYTKIAFARWNSFQPKNHSHSLHRTKSLRLHKKVSECVLQIPAGGRS